MNHAYIYFFQETMTDGGKTCDVLLNILKDLEACAVELEGL